MSEASVTEQGTEPTRSFDSLFTDHHQAVFRYCVRRLGSEEAEDAAADVFAVAWRRFDQIPPGDAARAWLIGAAYKVVGNRFRSRRRKERLTGRIESEQRTQSVSAIEHESQMVHLALGKLSAIDQELLRLSSWDGLSRGEIADVLGIRVNAVDQRLHRARARLKIHFEQIAEIHRASAPEEAQL